MVVGLAGLLDLGYVAFYAVGAYSFAIFAKTFGLNFWEALPIAGLLAATFGVLLGFPVLRLRGDYLAIVTLGFGEIVRVVLLNWNELSNGPKGIGDIPRPSFFGMPFTAAPPAGVTSFHQWFSQHVWEVSFSPIQRAIYLYYIILALALLTNWFTLRIRKLPISLAWEALREDEVASRALGINPTSTKLTAFAIGAMFGGFAGAFFATRQGFISPESFNFMESAIILAIVVLGGMGTQIGVVIAAILLIGGPEWFRDLESYRMLAFGGLMVLIMIWRPQGLLAFREPTIRLETGRGEISMSAALLTVEHLTMRFGGLVAVDDVSFTAMDRQITALIGPNGAGKTTLFNCITGFYRPRVGRLALHAADGREFLLERMDGFRIAQQARIARTFQNIRLFPRMSVLENLMVAQHNRLMRASGYTLIGLFGLGVYRRAKEAALERARYWLDRVQLLERANDEAGNLPYGAQRRLEIARAMCTEPAVAVPRRAGRRPERPRVERAERAGTVHPRHAQDRRSADRARHERGDEDLRAHRRARPWPQDRGRQPRPGAQRPVRDPRLSRRGRGRRAASRGRARSRESGASACCGSKACVLSTAASRLYAVWTSRCGKARS